ncbi:MULTISPECIES: SUMF1/EgtB/PvdO family nonheme iron enzyme [unclassified Anabaena]|uniref:SUMF1/EgtB/PvdO family nonheme iron enzyme n=1 Tax=unclassified Anabaena TaxID=2619674 RepID=UPI0039C5D295
MAKNWAIAIGINQYDYLQPLNYAKRDAQLMQQFLRQEVGCENIYFFSDDSPDIAGKSTRPNRANLLRVLRQLFEISFMGAGDNFWFFFSGHGIRHAGRDYLMPCDGDPEDIENTGIAINYVTERLRRCGADNVVLILDACRSLATRGGEGIGRQAAEKARQQGVISIFSCSPQEYSYEIAALQQGAFTTALLEGLGIQGKCATVERLNQYLNFRVPEIVSQHQKGTQTPYVIAEPVNKSHLILVPQYATLADIATLKNDAYQAEVNSNLELAEQLWMRVLAAASGQDAEAIKAIKRIARLPNRTEQLQTHLESGKQNSGSIANSPNPSKSVETPKPSQSVTNKPVNKPIQVPLQKQNSPIPNTAQNENSGEKAIQRPITPKQPPIITNWSRRKVIQAVGFGGTGLGLAILVPRILPKDNSQVVTVDKTGKIIERRNIEVESFFEDLGDGVTLEMAQIPGGTFTMGSPAGEAERLDRESPQRQVTVPGFFMGRYAVTQAQYQAIMGKNPALFKGDRRPVEQVSWDNAVEFCQKFSQKTGKTYRLPSEAEWEYACRAGTTTPFYFGETITTDLVNYDGNYPYGSAPKGEYRQQTTNVGEFPPNSFGLYDMHGNIWEWCQDVYNDNYQGAPTDGSAWINGKDNNIRLLRGGCWVSRTWGCRSANRTWDARATQSRDVGFRVVA